MRPMLCWQCIVWKVVSAIILLITSGMFLRVCAKLIPHLQSFKWAESSCSMWSTMVYFHILNRWFWMKFWSHHLCQSYMTSLWMKAPRKVKWTFMYDIGMIWKQGHCAVLDIFISWSYSIWLPCCSISFWIKSFGGNKYDCDLNG